MNLRKAAIGILTAGGLTIGLAISFGPHGARGQQQSGSLPQQSEQPVLQEPNPLSPLFNKQVGPFPPPVVQQTGGFGQYTQQFAPLSFYMHQRPLHPQRQQGFAVPASTAAKSQGTADDDVEDTLAGWRKKPGSDNDDDDQPVTPVRPSPKRLLDDDEPRPVTSRGKQNPFDDDDDVPPVRKAPQRPLADEVKEPVSQPKTDSYGSEMFSKGDNDTYIQYANFAPVSLEAPQRLVNSKKISLQYQVRNAGPSGVALVEVWRTCDGRKWEKYAQQANAKPPFLVEVEKEGLYGFIIIPRSGVGLARKAPVDGEAPQLWVEVDLTPPEIKVNNPVVGIGRDNGKLTITWTAKDRNLGPDPITISYAEETTGEWKPIASRIRNTGKFVWQIPPKTPYRFLVRVHAIDRAGNVGSDQTAKPVIVDLATPESVILGVDPVSR
ncbi:MAG TPA: hypothetical protein VGP68_03325 [Gemmataceae bacterium]|jgi:hypothetical protein|nr:hypothetical protein [Gemmataceae bacterium]